LRYCPYCHRLNLGRPVICHYCGRSWYVRLCPRGHENPYDAQFCGICGSADLTDPVEGRPWLIWLLKAMILATLCFFVYSMGYGIFTSHQLRHLFLSSLVCLSILVIGYYISISMLPAPVRRVLRRFHGWLWLKVKSVFVKSRG